MYEALRYSLFADMLAIHSQMIRDAARLRFRHRTSKLPMPATTEASLHTIARTVFGAEAGERIVDRAIYGRAA